MFPIYGEIELALKRLPKWMKDEGRVWDAALFFKPMRQLIHVELSRCRADASRSQDPQTTKGSGPGQLIFTARRKTALTCLRSSVLGYA